MPLREKLKQEEQANKSKRLDVQRSIAEREMLEDRINTKNLFFRTWVSYFLSLFIKDRGTIPSNIGMSVHVLSNMYITKDYMSTVLEICEWGGYVPMYAIGYITDALRRRGNGAKLSWSFMNGYYKVDKKDGLEERVKAWERALEPDSSYSRSDRERAARQLYTVELFNQGKTLMSTKVVLHIHGSTSLELDNAIVIVKDELSRMGIIYETKTYNVLAALQESAIMSTQTHKSGMTVMTNSHIAQMVPNFGGENDAEGVMFGINKLANVPYRIDFSKITIARNMYIVAPSGIGKTVIAINIMQSAIEQGYRLLIMDIKGNEYNHLINSINGTIVSLRVTSKTYINSWALHPSDVDINNPAMIENYFKERLSFTKTQIMCLSGITKREAMLEFESLLDEFIRDYYMSLGITQDNVKTWVKSESLTPFHMWAAFEDYYPSKSKLFKVASSTITTLRMFFTKEGTKSYLFTDDMDYTSIIKSPGISFDFGLLSSGTGDENIDMDVLKLKFIYMQKINRDYTSQNYAQGVRTLKCLEESQIVSDDLMHIYAKEYTLGRSQMQDTLLIGNSVSALKNAASAQPLLESTTCLIVSKLKKDALDFLIEQFGLESYRPLLNLPGSEPQYNNCFAVINNMQDHGMPGLVRVEIPKKEDGEFVKYKVNTPNKEALYE